MSTCVLLTCFDWQTFLLLLQVTLGFPKGEQLLEQDFALPVAQPTSSTEWRSFI